jgi:hypothetical protein
MQQSMVPAGGAGQQLAAFKQRDLKSPQYQVMSQGGPGAATADDNDVLHNFILSQKTWSSRPGQRQSAMPKEINRDRLSQFCRLSGFARWSVCVGLAEM